MLDSSRGPLAVADDDQLFLLANRSFVAEIAQFNVFYWRYRSGTARYCAAAGWRFLLTDLVSATDWSGNGRILRGT